MEYVNLKSIYLDIFDYIKEYGKKTDQGINNPYVEDLKNIVFQDKPESEKREILESKRSSLIEKYSFSIPFDFILNIIAQYSPLTEIGAGTGYFGYCLKQKGSDFEAFDLYSPDDADPFDFMSFNPWFEDTWINVLSGDEDTVRSCSQRTLFLCWPPPDSPMAFNALKIYEQIKGQTLIYIGDPVSS
ncbi:MAG: hypothetical protein ACQEQS_00440, partial [Thermodesulfobacteriota bacterium]